MKDLVKKVNEKDAEALSYLLKKYVPPLENFAMTIVKDRTVSEEIVAGTFDKLREKEKLEFEEEKNIKSFLYTTTRNACLDHLRRPRPTISELDETLFNNSDANEERHPDELELAKAEQEYAEILYALYDSIATLPEKQQQAFRLRHIEHKRIREIAIIMGISKFSVNNNLAQARKKIKKAMAPYLLKYKQIATFLSYFLSKKTD